MLNFINVIDNSASYFYAGMLLSTLNKSQVVAAQKGIYSNKSLRAMVGKTVLINWTNDALLPIYFKQNGQDSTNVLCKVTLCLWIEYMCKELRKRISTF